MLFSHFSQTLEKLEKTPSRLEMMYQLADLFKKLDQQEIKLAIYLMRGSLVPEYESLEFHLSTQMVMRALARLGTDLAEIKKIYKDKGDLGLVVQNLTHPGVHRGPPSPVGPAYAGQERANKLTISDIHQRLKLIAEDSGEGSQERKVVALADLLQAVDALSAKFIVRIIIGKLRLGFATMTMIDALSWAMTGSKEENKILEEAWQKKADLGELAQNYLPFQNKAERLKMLEQMQVQVGIPVMPALCQRLNSAQEIIDKLGEVYAEPKYDGLRVQIHFWRTKHGELKIKAFTRNLEDVSHMFPELQQLPEILQCQSCVLDSEAIGFDPQTGHLVEFQKTITRRRKHNVGNAAAQVPIRFYVFDVLELDGRSLIDETLRDRKELLANLFIKNRVLFITKFLCTTNIKELHKFHEDQLKQGLEGAVIKKIDAPYRSGRKGWAWVKIKEEEGTSGKLSDTLDCVVMGYYAGRGKRAQFGLGAILVGVLDEKKEQLQTIAKIGTGISEEQLVSIKKLCDGLKSAQAITFYDIPKGLKPDVLIEPKLVVEIAADELTKSPLHSAGVALRFPRLLRIRDDKSWEQATTIKELKRIG